MTPHIKDKKPIAIHDYEYTKIKLVSIIISIKKPIKTLREHLKSNKKNRPGKVKPTLFNYPDPIMHFWNIQKNTY